MRNIIARPFRRWDALGLDGQKDATGANFTLGEGIFFLVWMLHDSTKVLVRAVALLSATIGEIEKQRLDLFFGFDPLSKKNYRL